MGYLQVRNVPKDVIYKLDDMAAKKGMSREQFLRERLKSMTLEGEVKALEDKYAGIVNVLLERLEENNVIMEDVLDFMGRIDRSMSSENDKEDF